MQITRRIVFHAGHMLKDDTSKCYHPHGHEYVLECTLEGDIQNEGTENGMVMNFGNLKAKMMSAIHDVVDHKFIIEVLDPRFESFVGAVGRDGVYVVDQPPTAENLVKLFYGILNQELSFFGVKIACLKLQETYQCWVEYKGD